MSSYKGIVVPPSLTKTAGGQDMYIPVDPVGGGGDVIPGNLQVGGNLAVDGSATVDGAVSCGSTLQVTGAVTTLQNITCPGLTVNGGLTVGSAGPTVLAGDVTMTTPGATATLTNARITALLNNSLGASTPASISSFNTQYVLGVFSGWRVVFGWSNQGGADVTVTFGTAYTGLPIVLASISDQGGAGDSQIVRLSSVTRTNFNIHAEALNQTGGGNVNVSWIAIGQA